MRILITGGTGFIGSRLAERCADAGHEVAVLGREDANEVEIDTRQRLQNLGVEVLVGSVTDRDKMFTITRDKNIVFHLAAAQHEMNVSDDLFRAVNVEGTRNMLDASIAAGVERFVHGSSIGVYDREVEDIVDESTPLRPDNIYGVTKAEGESVVRDYFDRQSSTIIRISETYGPGSALLRVKPGGYEVVWSDPPGRYKAMQTHWNTPIYHEGHVYGSSGRYTNNAELRCIEWSTGRITWSEPGLTRASLLYVDGHFVCLGEFGSLKLIRVNPRRYELVSEYSLSKNPNVDVRLRDPYWSAPIVSHGLLYLHGENRLMCLELINQ